MKLPLSNKIFKVTYVLAFGYLFILTLCLGSLFPNIHLPIWSELVLKVTATVAILSILAWPFLFLVAKDTHTKKFSPYKVTAYFLLVGYFLIFLEALYVKLRTCGQFDESWHCHVEGKSFIGSAILVTLAATSIGLVVALLSRLKSKSKGTSR